MKPAALRSGARRALLWVCVAGIGSPAAAGSRFGLGFELLYERQESLVLTAQRGTIESRDLLNDRRERRELPGDPELLNRKFDFRLELAGGGPVLPIALPGGGGFRSTLVLEALLADVTLDFLDRTLPQDSTSLTGRGPVFAAALETTRSLCGRPCPWSAAAAYSFQTIPDVTMDRSPRFGPEGFAVLEDDVRFRRDLHAVSTRVSYGIPGGRVASYAGVVQRWTDLEIDDALSYRDPQGATETRLSSRTRLESEATLGVAGVEARLGPQVFGRLETAVGEGDQVVLARVVARFPSAGLSERVRSRDVPDITAQLALILEEFIAARASLPRIIAPGGAITYPPEAATDLIDWTEQRLLAILSAGELAAMRDHVRARAREARALAGGGEGAASFSNPRVTSPATLARWQLAVRPVPLLRLAQGVTSGDPVGSMQSLIERVHRLFRDNDFRVKVCFQSDPAGAWVKIHPASNKERTRELYRTNGWLGSVPRGDYVYKVERDGYRAIDCLPDSVGRSVDCSELNLMDPDHPFVVCELFQGRAGRCSVGEQPSPRRWSCETG